MLNVLKYAAMAGALILIPISSAHAAMTADECSAMFKKADTNGDGSLGGDEAAPYASAMTKANVETKDAGIITMDEFMSACQSGTFDGM